MASEADPIPRIRNLAMKTLKVCEALTWKAPARMLSHAV